MPYELFLYNIPKVSEDGEKAIPVPPGRTETLDDLEAAKKLAADHKGEFDRVVLFGTVDDKPRMIERYVDGQHEVKEQPVPA